MISNRVNAKVVVVVNAMAAAMVSVRIRVRVNATTRLGLWPRPKKRRAQNPINGDHGRRCGPRAPRANRAAVRRRQRLRWHRAANEPRG